MGANCGPDWEAQCHMFREEALRLRAELTAAKQRIAELEAERDEARIQRNAAQTMVASTPSLADAEQRGFERGMREGVEAAAKECERSMPDVYGDVEDITGQFVRAIRQLAKPPEQQGATVGGIALFRACENPDCGMLGGHDDPHKPREYSDTDSGILQPVEKA